MGFRSTVTASDYAIKWPEWFAAKYPSLHVADELVLSSKFESKADGALADLPKDIQTVLATLPSIDRIVLVYLHECGGVTRCEIRPDAIKWSEPVEWRCTDGITHSYCYGCSDVGEHMEWE